jgi:hypothetical protein
MERVDAAVLSRHKLEDRARRGERLASTKSLCKLIKGRLIPPPYDNDLSVLWKRTCAGDHVVIREKPAITESPRTRFG